MPKPPQGQIQRRTPRLYLVTPEVADAPAFARTLEAMIGPADVAAVLLRLAAADERTLINRLKLIAPAVQKAGAALVFEGPAEIAIRGGADGAHLTGIAAFSDALGRLKPDRIAGCGGMHTRHDAMLAAEQGADYVMFGEPADGRRPSFEAILERVAWWAELFEVPCVGFAAALDEVGPLAAAGADFVALGGIPDDAQAAAAAIAAAAERLAAAEAVT
jgi:thiamine-phosphate pyrophosphorylase